MQTLIPFAPTAAMLRSAATHPLPDDNVVFCFDGSEYSGQSLPAPQLLVSVACNNQGRRQL